MRENFDGFIEKLEHDLPELITPDMLVELGLGSHVVLFRLREKGALPYIKLSNARILYLKKDVIAWLRQTYTTVLEECLEECASNDSP